MDRHIDPFPDRIRVGPYVEKWLASKAIGDGALRPRTLHRYKQLLDGHVLEDIGQLWMDQVGPRHIRQIIESMERRGLAARTIAQARVIVHGIFRAAVVDEIVTRNPVESVPAPKAKRPDLHVPDADALRRLVEVAIGTVWEIPLTISAGTGMRRGEVMGIQWTNVDLRAGRLLVEKNLQRVDGALVFGDPKTDRGRRSIPLTDSLLERLRRYRQEQAERRLAFGPGWTDLDLVCDRGDGAPLDPDAFSKAFKRLALAAGCPQDTRLHDVRHAVASLLLLNGLSPLEASRHMGHASSTFTMDTYGHVLDAENDRAAKALERAFEEKA